jgi:glutaredoxin 3
VRPVTVYSTDICTLCNSVENLLNAREIPYEKVLLDEGSEDYNELIERTGLQTMPQVFVGNMLLGGFQETMAADQSGMLDDLLVD